MAAVGFEPTPPQRLVPKTKDHSATLPTSRIKKKTEKFFHFGHSSNPQRLVPKTSALDHSATLPTSCSSRIKRKPKFFHFKFRTKK
ncbi:hypothetical protein CEXT_329011 [Caerostris extrusa]|uniref:Uncharacterized protein n=1 Tax=Caerostris extrusa TaxID=172846 RepID=A0AAV4QX24_CAEEX|nr:hypothetical protein CEXT_329011 [Caerostris extrusa]